ncbi:hypothetical protein CONLIGDRAFT_706723 [Coniochaeta ligniaria NRRL 30616]|uniref:Uncharacterized protein n=1 Tax=Coniochaeta ligniaria NRRL 30616 TaxID=1408157 RepID=A0A1J7IZC9_9PEZI|nr:hypothetical protein CONLIGDRAFT_706723 [Coniochaeta ligniaria NRRL 30616]
MGVRRLLSKIRVGREASTCFGEPNTPLQIIADALDEDAGKIGADTINQRENAVTLMIDHHKRFGKMRLRFRPVEGRSNTYETIQADMYNDQLLSATMLGSSVIELEQRRCTSYRNPTTPHQPATIMQATSGSSAANDNNTYKLRFGFELASPVFEFDSSELPNILCSRLKSRPSRRWSSSLGQPSESSSPWCGLYY